VYNSKHGLRSNKNNIGVIKIGVVTPYEIIIPKKLNFSTFLTISVIICFKSSVYVVYRTNRTTFLKFMEV
jgi:hypothetical protein